MEQNIVLLTGMSGAGKTSAMNALEDQGYYCIDNFPKELLPQLERLLVQERRYDYVALSVSALDYMAFLNYFENVNAHISIIFLDCSDEELLLRYRFTRRRHPLIASEMATTLEEAIEMERDYFDCISESSRDVIRFDTTKMATGELAKRIRNRIESTQESVFTITFQSFGFKHGMPMDADTVFDVRFLPNPFYEPELRELNGNDPEVYDYVINHQETQAFLKKLEPLMDEILTSYNSQHKSHFVVAIGCTGGQHRSVSICNWLYTKYKGQYRCFKSHRDSGGDET